MDANTALQRLQDLFSRDQINQQAKQMGVCQRLRSIQPFELLASLVLGLADRQVDAIADLHRTFNGITMAVEDGVAMKPFHNQLRKPTLPALLKHLAEDALFRLQQPVLRPKCQTLKRFRQVLLQDGTSFALHDKLAEHFPGRFKTKSPAAVECHATMSLLADNPIRMSLTADKASERAELPAPESLLNCLLLADRGYFDLDYSQQINQAGGYYIIRAMKSINPEIEQAYSGQRGRVLHQLVGQKLKSLSRRKSRASVLDLVVHWPQHRFRGRLVVSWNAEEKQYSYWLTNLPREEYSATKIIGLYRLRWQVELLFKEWKSFANLRRFVTRDRHIAEVLIWASLLALLVKRYVAHCTQRLRGTEISTRKVAKATQSWLDPLIRSLVAGGYIELRADWCWALDYLARNAARDNPQRDRQDGRLQSGLEIQIA